MKEIINKFSNYQYTIAKSVADAPFSKLDTPWSLLVDDRVESLAALGFSKEDKYLLCSDGYERWMYCLKSGKHIYKQEDNKFDDFWTDENLSIAGFGQTDGEEVLTSGVYGDAGGLRKVTADGWRVHDFIQPYYRHNIIVTGPQEDLFCKSPKFKKLDEIESDIVLVGFNKRGNYLLVAERTEIRVYAR